MPVRDCKTEIHIINTAIKVFFEEGRVYATTQEIADAAGVNRTLINYYFRSKKDLFKTVIKTAREEFRSNSDAILLSGLPFREKTEKFLDEFINNLSKYPYLESFITVDIIQNRLKQNISPVRNKKSPAALKQYLKEIEIEMKEGRIPSSSPVHFMMNLFSLMIYPLIMKPLQMNLLDLNEEEYNEILNKRKQVILATIFPETYGKL
jgi:TetR/AcrR family transcriptional regulator